MCSHEMNNTISFMLDYTEIPIEHRTIMDGKLSF